MKKTLPLPFALGYSQAAFQGTEGIPQGQTHLTHLNKKKKQQPHLNSSLKCLKGQRAANGLHSFALCDLIKCRKIDFKNHNHAIFLYLLGSE